ncbi:MAG TPA: HtaA domain-containing protein [Solirubrobacteraceae bacterium]|nr:HtaA domain-containing protein [Solirubrobacteraceae bacterium]
MSTPPSIGLRWTLKRSFLEYVARAPDGKATVSAGATATSLNEILFEPDPRDHRTPSNAETFYAFRGAITFSAHFGMLMVRIADPWVTIEENLGEVTVLDPYEDPGANARLRLATFEIADHRITDGLEHWTAALVRLASEGCVLFNDVYEDGVLLDPLTIIVPTRCGSD